MKQLMEINRRSFLASMAATIAVPTVSAAAEPSAQTSKAPIVPSKGKRPRNVILMICDDLGYGDLGCYGSSLPTPNLDAMAAGGLRFTHFNAGHPLCSASRAALLTGRYGQRSGVRGAFGPHEKSGLSLQETTLADIFRKRGFRTQAIGKWHLGSTPDYLPTNRGFDAFYGVPYSDDMKPLPLIRDTESLEADTDRSLLTPRYTEEALRFLFSPHDKPFFLYMAFSYPHDPARASERFRGKSGFGDFGDAVQEIDWSVGEIIQSLRKQNLLHDTLILFTSDHGPWFQGSPGNLRGRKSTTFEGGFRVPLLAHWPAAIQAGEVSSAWTSNLDIVPTLTALCDLSPSPNPLDGVDVTQNLLGSPQDAPRKAVLYFTPSSSNGMDVHCARKGDWKLRFAQLNGEIYVNDYTGGHKSFWLPRPELYNVRKDPSESYDVAKLHPEIVKDIFDDLDAQMKTMPEPVTQAFAQLRQNIARATTPPGAAPRPQSTDPVPDWALEAKDRP
jgi:arylsulfatase A